MKYTKATNYALHTMLHFMVAPPGETIGVQAMAQMQKISPTYLSKVLSKLVKVGLIESTTGVNGGYHLIGPKENVSFLQVIQAIERTGSLFNCGLKHTGPDCLIQHTMAQAEGVIEQYLAQQKLIDLAQQINEANLVVIKNSHS